MTDIPVWLLITSVGSVCTIYSTVGGLKAVVSNSNILSQSNRFLQIWTDTFQAVIMYTGCITLVTVGTVSVGGISRVLTIARDHGRLDGFVNIDPNPFQRMTVWTALLGN